MSERRIPSEKKMKSQFMRFGMLRIPSERVLEDALKKTRAPEPPELGERKRWSLLQGGKIVFPKRGARGRLKPLVRETWVFAEKESLVRALEYDRFVPLTEAVGTTRYRKSKEGRYNPQLRITLEAIPERAVVVSDANEQGRFLAESIANYLSEDRRVKSVKFAVAATPEAVRDSLREYAQEDPSGYSEQARFAIVRAIYDAGYNRIADAIENLVERLRLFPKKSDQPFYLPKRGRVAFHTLLLLDDLETEKTATVNVNGVNLRIPVSSIADPTRARITINPTAKADFYAVSHDQAVRWLVERGVSPDDAEMVLERLWLRGVISYPRNNGKAVHPADLEKVKLALSDLGRTPPSSFFESDSDIGIYLVDGKTARELTGVEREFTEWLADRLSAQSAMGDIKAEFFIGKTGEPVDTRFMENVSLEITEPVDGIFPVIKVENNEDGVPVSRLFEELQRLGIGTEATRAMVLRDLEKAGYITTGERLKLTHNGKVLSTIIRMVYANAGDSDKTREILNRLKKAAKDNEKVDKALRDAWTETFKKREDFLRDVYRALIPPPKKRQLSPVENVALGLLINGKMTLRDIRKDVLGERAWNRLGGKNRILEMLKTSGYFTIIEGETPSGKIRRDAITIDLSEKGYRYAVQLHRSLLSSG